MKTARFLFPVMIAATLLLVTSFAAYASPASHQAISQRSEKFTDQKRDEVRNEQEQAGPNEGDKNQEQSANATRPASKRRSSASHSKPVPSDQVRPTKRLTPNSPRTDARGNVAPVAQMGSKLATNIPNKAVSRRGVTPTPPTVGVNGQQFKNSRDPGERLAMSGGPLTAAKGTAAINGTSMKRKP
jgi:hypothetical protein